MRVRHVQGDRAYYHMKRDEIVLPERGQFPSANQLLPDCAPRARPQHRAPRADEPRDPRRRDQERVRIARLREGGAPGRDQRDDDGRARRRRSRPEPGRRLRRGLGPGARRGPARDPASRSRRAEDLRLLARAGISSGSPRGRPWTPRGNPWPWPRPGHPDFSGSRCPVPQIPTPQRGAGPSR